MADHRLDGGILEMKQEAMVMQSYAEDIKGQPEDEEALSLMVNIHGATKLLHYHLISSH